MAGIAFEAPAGVGAFTVVERLAGTATTDFGAPDVVPAGDWLPVDDHQLARFESLLGAYWQAFDAAVQAAGGHELRKGPRGGGRELDGIIRHVLGSDAGYLGALGWKLQKGDAQDLSADRQAILAALAAAVRGDISEHGPRGGARWPPRYFVRRLGWHMLDHAWEIEDRLL